MVIIVATNTEEIKEAFAWLSVTKDEGKVIEEKPKIRTKAQRYCAKFSEIYESGKYIILRDWRYSNIDYVDKAPKSPGVYIFFDEEGDINYIGSSKDLYYRVEQSYKERRGFETVHAISWQKTINEDEARDLEAVLIRKYTPKLNKVTPTRGDDDNCINPFELEKHIVVKWSTDD